MQDLRRLDVAFAGDLGAAPRDRPGHALDVVLARRASQLRSAPVDGGQGVGADHRHDGVPHGVLVVAWRGLGNVVAELFAKPRRFVQRRPAVGVHRRAVGIIGRNGNAKTARLSAHFVEEGARGRGGVIGIARIGPRRGIKKRRAVAHRKRHRVRHAEPGPAFAGVGAGRVPRAGRLQAEQAAERGRHADRAAAVAGMAIANQIGRRPTLRNQRRFFRVLLPRGAFFVFQLARAVILR